jgi:hypothetical protein
VPSHLYEKLPEHLLSDGTPDYLRMILMCKWAPTLKSVSTQPSVQNCGLALIPAGAIVIVLSSALESS